MTYDGGYFLKSGNLLIIGVDTIGSKSEGLLSINECFGANANISLLWYQSFFLYNRNWVFVKVFLKNILFDFGQKSAKIFSHKFPL